MVEAGQEVINLCPFHANNLNPLYGYSDLVKSFQKLKKSVINMGNLFFSAYVRRERNGYASMLPTPTVFITMKRKKNYQTFFFILVAYYTPHDHELYHAFYRTLYLYLLRQSIS